MTSHALSALIAKRAELAGQLHELERQAAQARANLIHLDAVIRPLDPDIVPEEIAPKRVVKRDDWFGPSELPRLVLDTLRTAAEPLTLRRIAEAVMARHGLPAGDRATLVHVEKRVDATCGGRRGGSWSAW